MNQPIVIQQAEPRIMRDPIRNEKRFRMRVRVNTHSTSVHQAVPESGHYSLTRGEHEVIAYESQVPLILAKVETRQDEIERAKEVVRRMRRVAMEHAMEGQGPNLYGWRDVDPLEYGSPSNPELRRVFRSSDGMDYSVDGEFRRSMGRSILPLTMAERIEELPPLRSEDEKRTLDFAELIGKALAQSGGASGLTEERLVAIATEAAARTVAAMLATPAPKSGRDR